MRIMFSKTAKDEIIRRVILAWDPDFTKLTPEEADILKKSEQERENGDVFTENEIDWN